MKLADSVTLVPYVHGRLAFARHVRDLCLQKKFDCIAVDLPACLEEHLFDAIADLPYISAVIAQGAADEVLYYAPIDPCDASIEAIRQSRQNHVRCFCTGTLALSAPVPLPPLPDDYALDKLGFDAYSSLCLRMVAGARPAGGLFPEEKPGPMPADRETAAQFIACRLHHLRYDYKSILALVHLGNFAAVVSHFEKEKTCNLSFAKPPSYTVTREFINPDHLYFALGELPFVTGKFERERYEPFSRRIDPAETIKSLFTETRDEYCGGKEDAVFLSPARIQRGLTFLRNLTVADSRFVPTLFDIVAAAKGVGGNAYALHILKSARYYPYLPFELGRPLVSVGIDKVQMPGETGVKSAVNLFRDVRIFWRTLSIKPDPSQLTKRKYRFSWNPGSVCSHVPEDARIEHFNAHVRKKAESVVCEDRSFTEKFTVSVKDGIDIRETMRNWFTPDIYVREVPPSQGKTDMVVIIFDEGHDEKYPHCATWYAEHEQESTLTFYATDPFTDMLGPGIARSHYGGLSLLFPPRMVPNVFALENAPDLKSLTEYLAYGGLLFSQEKIIPYVAAKKPGVRLVALAKKFKKRFVWIPLSAFSMETIRRLRTFHVLNGKTVRSWAARFIGE
jgi:hypothetical protein